MQHDREWPRNIERSTHCPLHKVVVTIVMSDGLAQEPPWPNGQGVRLLIRRLRAQVPQGVLYRHAAAEVDVAAAQPQPSTAIVDQHTQMLRPTQLLRSARRALPLSVSKLSQMPRGSICARAAELARPPSAKPRHQRQGY